MLFAPEATNVGSITIRSYLPGDGTELGQAVVDSYEHLKEFMPWATPNQSPEQSEQIVRAARARYLLNEDFMLGIFDGKRVIGGCGYHLGEGSLERRSAEIGMWIHAQRARQGLATAVLRELLRWGFDEWPWIRLSWHCDAKNVASARVAQKAGMVHEGTLRGQWSGFEDTRRDTRIFAALKGEWS